MKICYIINKISETSIPIEIANYISKTQNIQIISFYDCNHVDSDNIITLGFKCSRLKAIIKLIKLLKNEKFDVIHTHHSISGAFTRLLSFYFSKSKIITTVHTDVSRFSFLSKFILKIGIKNNDMVICNSENTKASFITAYGNIVSSEKLKVIYNGVDKERINNSIDDTIYEKCNLNSKHKILGIIARLEKVKNHLVLLKAFKILYEKNNQYRLIIVGNGKDEQSIKKYVSNNNLEACVIFTGLLKKEDAYKVLNILDVFVMPSFYEGFCNSVVEAMFAKKELIVSDISTLREVTQNSAKYFQVDDYKELARLISQCSGTDNTIDKLFDIANQNYTIEKTVDNHILLYEELFSDKV